MSQQTLCMYLVVSNAAHESGRAETRVGRKSEGEQGYVTGAADSAVPKGHSATCGKALAMNASRDDEPTKRHPRMEGRDVERLG